MELHKPTCLADREIGKGVEISGCRMNRSGEGRSKAIPGNELEYCEIVSDDGFDQPSYDMAKGDELVCLPL
jgi:hypothetical protein